MFIGRVLVRYDCSAIFSRLSTKSQRNEPITQAGGLFLNHDHALTTC